METVSSTRLGRASSRYGAPAVFTGPVRKWQKKWVHVSSSSLPNNNNNNSQPQNNNNNASSRLLLRRWTPITASSDDTADVSDEPPRRKFRYTPIAVLEEQKKGVIEKVEHEFPTESGQSTPKQTNVSHEVLGELDINEISEETKDSNMSNLDFGFQGNNGEKNNNNNDDDDHHLEKDNPMDNSMN